MADYYPLLAKAVSALPSSDREQRTAIYERARKALVGQLRSITPAVQEADIDREIAALDSAITRLEAELAQARSASPAPPSSAPARKSLPPLPPLPPKLDLAQLAKSTRARPIPKPSNEPQDQAKIATGAKPNVPSSERLEPLARQTGPEPKQSQDSQDMAPPVVDSVSSTSNGLDRPILAPNPPSSKAPLPKAQISDSLGPSALGPAALGPAALGPARQGADQADPKFQIEAPVLVADKEPVFAPITTQDLSLAQPPKRQRLTPVRFLMGLAVLLSIAMTAILAFYWRDIPQGTARPLPAPAPQAQEPVETQSKIVERIGGPQTQSSPQTQPSAPASQRAALLIEAPDVPEKFKTYLGNVAWRLESMGRGQGQDLAQAIRIEVDIQEANLKLMVLIQKNVDPALPASHTLSMRFSPLQNSLVSEVAEIDLPVTRNETSSELDPLVGVMAKITQNIFLVGLNNDPIMRTRNLEFLKARNWLDIPMRLTDGRMAKITFEKGSAGERVMADALAAWR
ncbi:MAG: hypothetical protein EBY21_05005 [Alphaproteobacteria bacterium]|nr:hypothetical protein [Alphaproteobacteria bacterium]